MSTIDIELGQLLGEELTHGVQVVKEVTVKASTASTTAWCLFGPAGHGLG